MKAMVHISRVLVGCLFIFSGLVKAIDPKGLAYKMQEFFEVWAAAGYFKSLMEWLNDYALGFSVFMITLEVVLGTALLIGWQKKCTTWLLLLLTLFFTFLTSYVLFSGKIRACGCFGDCIPLTPVQTFTKDIVLTLLIIIILIGQKHIKPLLGKWLSYVSIIAVTGLVLYLQFYVQRHLPVKDCLPYKEGNDILALRKTPADATYDKFFYSYIYKKAGQEKEFGMDLLPDSTWEFVKESGKKLVEKGNGKTALINDFSLTTQSGNDTTQALLGTPGDFYLLFIKDAAISNNAFKAAAGFLKSINNSKMIFIVTAQPDALAKLFNSIQQPLQQPVLSCDGTAIKTAARSDATLYFMKAAVIQKKYGWADLQNALPLQ
jgi:uncharacterized membrane protein YphA (DoxX/SURF4 family)